MPQDGDGSVVPPTNHLISMPTPQVCYNCHSDCSHLAPGLTVQLHDLCNQMVIQHTHTAKNIQDCFNTESVSVSIQPHIITCSIFAPISVNSHDTCAVTGMIYKKNHCPKCQNLSSRNVFELKLALAQGQPCPALCMQDRLTLFTVWGQKKPINWIRTCQAGLAKGKLTSSSPQTPLL